MRGFSTIAVARAAVPDVKCTTRPPAKSNTPSALSHPPAPQTQWHTGLYTKITQSRLKRRNGPNFMRSAKAPVISAGVITANMH